MIKVGNNKSVSGTSGEMSKILVSLQNFALNLVQIVY